MIRLHPLDRLYQAHKSEWLPVMDEIYSSGRLYDGEWTRRWEQNLCKITGASHAVSVASGTDALFFGLKAIGIQPGDEILVTSHSFISSASAILRAGATPVFVDVDPATHLMDLNQLESASSEKTKAVMAVSIYGNSVDYERLRSLTEKNGWKVIEDAAQSWGTRWNDQHIGSFADVTCFSFDPAKVFTGYTHGGAVVTDIEEYALKAQSLANHGREGTEHQHLGYKSKVPEITAAILCLSLPHEEKWQKRREEVSMQLQRVCDDRGIKTVKPPAHCRSNWHKFVVETEKREALIDSFQSHNIDCKVHYSKPLSQWEVVQNASHRVFRDTVAKSICSRVLTIPNHAFLSDSEVQKIAEVLSS